MTMLILALSFAKLLMAFIRQMGQGCELRYPRFLTEIIIISWYNK